jgi:hypothetical protein
MPPGVGVVQRRSAVRDSVPQGLSSVFSRYLQPTVRGGTLPSVEMGRNHSGLSADALREGALFFGERDCRGLHVATEMVAAEG